MILEEVFPNSGRSYEVTEHDHSALEALYPPVAGFRFNHVISTKRVSPNSDSLTNELDRLILKHIRSVSDLIVTSGNTARRENLKASRYAPMLVLTRTKDKFSFHALEQQSTKPVYITQTLGTEYPNQNAVAIGLVDSTAVEFSESFCHLNKFSHVVLESGPTVAREFAAGALLSEIDITVTKTIEGSRAMSEAESFLSVLGVESYERLQTLNHEDTWFLRFRSPRGIH